MKTFSWLASVTFKFMNVFLFLTLAVLWTSCSDQAEIAAPVDDASGKKAAKANGNSNSQSQPGDYIIEVNREGSVFTYTITKNPGAKGLSHFILNLQNCAERSSTIDNILWATVNGQPAKLESSEGNTGCYVSSVTTNFVKFDDLADANVYVIKFEFDYLIGGFVTSTAWLKAGNSCVEYQVTAPCCPL